MADNFHFDMTGVPLDKALQIAFMGAPGGKAAGWQVFDIGERTQSPGGVWGASRATQRLVLFWTLGDSGAAVPFPAGMGAEATEPFVKAWLGQAAYGRPPDHDGDNERGSRVYNEEWGHIGNDAFAFVAIEPVWLMYGK